MTIEGKANGRPWPAYPPLGCWAYLGSALPLLLVEYAAAMTPRVVAFHADRLPSFLKTLAGTGRSDILMIGVIVLASIVLLGWLSARRAKTVNAPGSIMVLAVVPWLQLIAIPILAFFSGKSQPPSVGSLSAMRGVFWGLSIAVAAEIVFTLAFGQFGIALFVGSPFLVGLVTAYYAARDGHPHPLIVAQVALLLASTVLFGFAFEGLFCLLLAYPLAALAVVIGGGVGIVIARRSKRQGTALSSIALLPLLFAAETAAPPSVVFGDTRSIEVAAPPAAVWKAIVHMGTIVKAPAAPFGWGLAYPVAGRIDGRGVGAIRLGVFSTGTAYERVTRWQPNRELWFDVLSDPPMMRETNPFGPVRSAHLEGYFATHDARFTLTELSGSRTRLTLTTSHELKIGPTAYFLPIARWAVDENKRRVLAHFRDRAQQGVAGRQE